MASSRSVSARPGGLALAALLGLGGEHVRPRQRRDSPGLALAALLGLGACGEPSGSVPEPLAVEAPSAPRPARTPAEGAAATLVDPGSVPEAEARLEDPGAPELERAVLSQDEADALAEEAIAPGDLDVQLESLERELRGDG